MNKTLFPLNGIKGIGSFIIAFMFHYNHFVSAESHPLYRIKCLDIFIEFGWMAVELFFFLSGITFMALYADKIREGRVTGEKYALLRFSKLWPIHIFSLFVVTLFQGIRVMVGLEQFKFTSNDLYDFLLNVLMMHALGQGNGAGYNWVSWTLTVNILLYFLFYWMCKKSKNDNDILLVSFILFFVGLYDMKSGGWLIFSADVGRGVSTFFWGVMCATIYKRFKSTLTYKSVVFAILSVIGFLTISVVLTTDLSGNSRILATTVTATYITAFTYIAIEGKLFSRILSCKPLMALGTISFSLFMIHYPLQAVLTTINDYFMLAWDYSRFGFWFGFVLISLGCAYLAYEYIEKRCSDLIRAKYNDYFSALK